jgi:hypothetical protein
MRDRFSTHKLATRTNAPLVLSRITRHRGCAPGARGKRIVAERAKPERVDPIAELLRLADDDHPRPIEKQSKISIRDQDEHARGRGFNPQPDVGPPNRNRSHVQIFLRDEFLEAVSRTRGGSLIFRSDKKGQTHVRGGSMKR